MQFLRVVTCFFSLKRLELLEKGKTLRAGTCLEKESSRWV